MYMCQYASNQRCYVAGILTEVTSVHAFTLSARDRCVLHVYVVSQAHWLGFLEQRHCMAWQADLHILYS